MIIKEKITVWKSFLTQTLANCWLYCTTWEHDTFLSSETLSPASFHTRSQHINPWSSPLWYIHLAWI